MLVLVISLISISNSELCNEILNDVLIKVQDLQKVVQDLIDIPKAGEIFKSDSLEVFMTNWFSQSIVEPLLRHIPYI